ncbi:hypothetical protein [Propionispora vibrioides]|uniref:Uncharacterized protein n=1 Tax=Propionispora vibrioides TaxID=112903 RepID=A0A1H8SUW0_9FIRM|nr:hypothetical protein [Propionispora vibrioides]SEO82276.1 hypothetical protein SAMN04490178_105196 [Propionispora vibrioides]
MRRVRKYQDTLASGAFSGIIATAITTLLSWLLLQSGVSFTSLWIFAGALVLNDSALHTPWGISIGMITHLMLGGIFGVITAFTLRLTGKDYYLIKGLGVATCFFIGARGIIQVLTNIAPWMRDEILSTIITLINLLLTGIISSYLIAKRTK